MTEREARLEETLKIILAWDVPKVFDPYTGRMMSLEYLRGSNGVRDYFQDIIGRALNEK